MMTLPNKLGSQEPGPGPRALATANKKGLTNSNSYGIIIIEIKKGVVFMTTTLCAVGMAVGVMIGIPYLLIAADENYSQRDCIKSMIVAFICIIIGGFSLFFALRDSVGAKTECTEMNGTVIAVESERRVISVKPVHYNTDYHITVVFEDGHAEMFKEDSNDYKVGDNVKYVHEITYGSHTGEVIKEIEKLEKN